MTSNTLLQRIRQHQYLLDLRNKLLQLHRVLLETQRITYEQLRGRVSTGELLQLVIDNDEFAWLHRISEIIVQIDEMLQADEPLSKDEVQMLINNVRMLLTPSEDGNTFGRNYYIALQSDPSAVLAHAEVSALLDSDV